MSEAVYAYDTEKRNTFEYVCSGRAASFNKFSQSSYIKSKGLTNSSGVCYALSIFYLTCDKKGWPFKSEISDLATTTFIDKLQSVLNGINTTPGKFDVIPQRVENGIGAAGLQIAGLSNPANVPFSLLSKYIVQSAGLYLINLPNHCIAAIHRPDDSYELFDPNFGRAKFTRVLGFTTALEYFLSDLKIMQLYDLRDGDPALALRLR